MIDQYYDKLLNIKTMGDQKVDSRIAHYHRYEPTPYFGLEALFEQYKLKSSDRFVDFGCGKGRLNFYVHYLFDATVIGIEMNKTFYQEAVANQYRYREKYKKGEEKIFFQCCLAEEYAIHPSDNRFYFFNPFSIQIFIKVINNILSSVELFDREIELIVYYGSDEYIYYLENQTSFELVEEVILPRLYEHNPYERFLIYRLV